MQLLEEHVSLSRYWNYLRRQLYVMDTYVSPHNRRINHAMLALHTYLSWAFVLPCLTGQPSRTPVDAPDGTRLHLALHDTKTLHSKDSSPC